MHKPAFRIATIVLASFAATAIGRTAIWHSSSAQGAPENNSKERTARVDEADRSKLRSLQRELIETLGVVRSALEQERQSGFVTSSDVLRENIELLGAELDTRETNADRLVVLERIADQYRELENNAAQVAQRTPSSPAVLLRPKAERLKAEIAVERCRLQITAGAKY
jgi:hypothetical protein